MVPESLFGLSSTQIKKKCGLTISDYNILNEIKNNSTPFLQQMITLYHTYMHGLLQMSCRTTFTWWHDTVGKSLEYLDNFDVHCHHGEFLRQWRMTWGERGKKKAIRFVCCKYGPASVGR